MLVWLPLTQTELCPFLNLGVLLLGPSASGECFIVSFSHGANITILLSVKEQPYLHETPVAAKGQSTYHLSLRDRMLFL